MESETNDTWVSIRQYRKNLKSNKSFAYVIPHDSQGNSFSNHYRSFSQNKTVFLKDVSRQNSDKEIMTNQNNILSTLESHTPHNNVNNISNILQQKSTYVSPIMKEPKTISQSFQTTLEISTPSCSGGSTIDQPTTDRNAIWSSNRQEEIIFNPFRKNERATEVKKSFIVSFQELLEDKTTRRERTKESILVRDDEQSTKRSEILNTREDFKIAYRSIEAVIEKKYINELQEKDQEIKALRIALAMKVQRDQQEKPSLEVKKKIEEYEEIINGMRKTYEEKLISSEKYYKKKLLEFVSEREKLLEELGKLRLEIKQLKETKPQEEPVSVEPTERKKVAISTETIKARNAGILNHNNQLKGTKLLFEKINQCITRNSFQIQNTDISVSIDKKSLNEYNTQIETRRNQLFKSKEYFPTNIKKVSAQKVNPNKGLKLSIQSKIARRGEKSENSVDLRQNTSMK